MTIWTYPIGCPARRSMQGSSMRLSLAVGSGGQKEIRILLRLAVAPAAGVIIGGVQGVQSALGREEIPSLACLCLPSPSCRLPKGPPPPQVEYSAVWAVLVPCPTQARIGARARVGCSPPSVACPFTHRPKPAVAETLDPRRADRRAGAASVILRPASGCARPRFVVFSLDKDFS